MRYEEKDVRFGCIMALLIAAGGILVTQFSAVWFFFRGEQRSQAVSKESPYPLSPSSSGQLPPEPRLEQVDRMEHDQIANVRLQQAEQLKFLNSSGPTDEKGFVHIPIEEAMKRIADQLPVRRQPPETGKDRGLTDSGQSNSGRMFRGGTP